MTDTDSKVAMRRRDRGQDDAWIAAFLEASLFGHMATVADGWPFVNSNLFVYDRDAHAIYLHTFRAGRVRSNLEEDERVCFSVGEMGRLLPADEALEFSVEFASVVAFGRGRVIADPVEAENALQQLLDKYAPHLRPGRDYRAITADELKRTGVYRIDIDEWSGKQKFVEDDFPGAFTVPPPPIPFGETVAEG